MPSERADAGPKVLLVRRACGWCGAWQVMRRLDRAVTQAPNWWMSPFPPLFDSREHLLTAEEQKMTGVPPH
jgi:hypothetical protein